VVSIPRTVFAYHGCDEAAAERILLGEKFKSSENNYDWLGSGIYLWEYGPNRALRWAENQRRRGRIKSPAVVGAIVALERCFDLLDTRFTTDLGLAFESWRAILEEQGVELPENTGPERRLRKRDCALMNWYLARLEVQGKGYDTVRGAFLEGPPAFPGSDILRESHVQLCVRNPACILGVFRPRMEEP
jgi:hypothetical protein